MNDNQVDPTAPIKSYPPARLNILLVTMCKMSEESQLRWCGDPAGKEVHACACVGAVNCCGPRGLTYEEWVEWLGWKEERSEMERCPHCGEEGSVCNWHIGDPALNDEEAYVKCDSCEARGPVFLKSSYGPAYRVKAQQAWNRRVDAREDGE